jgi:hypothetical protein
MKKNSRLIQNQTSGGLSGRLIGNSLPSYLGLFFETFCQKNITQIIKSLNIEPATIIDIGPYFRQSSKNITLERVLISASGVTPEVEASDYFHRILGLEAIFN